GSERNEPGLSIPNESPPGDVTSIALALPVSIRPAFKASRCTIASESCGNGKLGDLARCDRCARSSAAGGRLAILTLVNQDARADPEIKALVVLIAGAQAEQRVGAALVQLPADRLGVGVVRIIDVHCARLLFPVKRGQRLHRQLVRR